MFEKIIFFFTIIVLSIFSFIYSNKVKDTFLPFNFWIFIFTIFHSNLFITNYEPVIYYFIISLMLILFCGGIFGMIIISKVSTVFFSIFEVSAIKARSLNFFLQKLVWIVTLLPLAGFAYIIYSFGGIDGYLLASKKGNEVLTGFGFFLLLKSFIYPINIFYFAVILKHGLFNANRLSYFFHIVLVIIISFSTLSRGTLLTHFFFIILLYHYLYKNISIYSLVLFSFIFILFSSFYGVLREVFYFSKDGLLIHFEDRILETQWSFAGLFPLSKILLSNVFDAPLALGETYLAGITRFLPSNFFPDKLKGAGELFTTIYANDIYGEGTHFSAGFVAEAIVNFGFIGGIIFSYIQVFIIGLILIFLYKSINREKNEFFLVFYCYCLWYFSLLIVGEFASFFYIFVIKVFVTIFLFRVYYFKIRYDKSKI
jgi:oligosaccharide repeat unit polymerase